MEEQRQNIVEAIALIDIDPTLIPFASEQQKWLSGLQITGDSPRDRPNTKAITLVPGVFLVLSFCENNKDPIYEIQFSNKPGHNFNYVKTTQAIHQSIGAYICYKTEPSMTSGPICDIHMLAIERKSRFGENKQVLNVPHGYKMISHQLPFGYLIFRKVKNKVQQNFKAVLAQKYCTIKGQRINLSHLPLFCFPDGIKIVRQIRGFATFNFIFTLADAEQVYVSCLIFKENISERQRQKLEIYTNDNYFYEKALCLITNTRYTDQFAECLQHLYRLSLSKSDVPFWRIIQSFADNMLLPSQSLIGKVALSYCYSGNPIIFPTNIHYPCISQRALYSIFKFMTVQNIISVFESLLLQRKVLFVSQSKTILGYATQAFLSLLYPFKWQQVLIPILPSSLRDYLTAPVPLVAGISPALVDSSIETDVKNLINQSVIVYLDKNQVLNDEDNPPLPEKLLRQLMKKLQVYKVYDGDEVTQFLDNPQSTYLFKMQEVTDPNFHGYLVRDIFLDFFLTLMKNYRKYCVKPKEKLNKNQSSYDEGQPSFSDIFKMNEFLSDLGMTKIGSFGYKFTESSVFISFIENKYHNPKNSEILFFDECLDRKKSKKDAAFIINIENQEVEKIKNPQIDPQNKGPFFYQHFPSLLGQPQNIKQEDIQLIIEDEEDIENQAIQKIDQQFWINMGFYEQQECENAFHSKIKGLLLNKNKRKFPEEIQNQKQLVSWFIEVYSKQSLEIQNIFNQWPGILSDIKVNTMSKCEYLKMGKYKKGEKKEVIVVQENGDFQIIIKDAETKIIFAQSGTAASFSQKTGAIVIEVASHRLKKFLNSIIPKQGNFLLDYCSKQANQSLRASTFKKITYQTWNIETVIAFRDWLHSQKQFATGITYE